MCFEKIREIISEQIDIDINDITMNMNLKNDLNADSLDLFQIINDIEDEFNIKIEDAEKIITVEDAVNFVKEQINNIN